jgi:hypothetical protein
MCRITIEIKREQIRDDLVWVKNQIIRLFDWLWSLFIHPDSVWYVLIGLLFFSILVHECSKDKGWLNHK